ncbi:MAG: hypothetical protein Q4P34_04190 [Tissierellia bacterium]|nr:hypothetical protein [Tissierellia bacterium]
MNLKTIYKTVKVAKKIQAPRLAKIGFLSTKIGIRRARKKDIFMKSKKE